MHAEKIHNAADFMQDILFGKYQYSSFMSGRSCVSIAGYIIGSRKKAGGAA